MIRFVSTGLAALLLASCSALPFGGGETEAPATIDPARLSAHVQTLSSDAFEGRGPATAGEVKTVEYIAAQFAAVGLQPGGPNGSWYQDVVLQRFEKVGTPAISFQVGGQTVPVAYGTQAVVGSQQPVSRVTLDNAPLVFVGYGIVAPERNWNDYAGVDMRGKVAVVLVNDADFEEPALSTFGGKAMTYYGRWTYKFEEAARQGAAGILIVHETKPASYGWATVQGSWSAPQFDIVRADPMKERVPAQGWIQRDVAVDLFRRAGLDFEQAKASARRQGFRPVTLNASFSTDFGVKSERIATRNVVGRLPGKARPDETILYTAHWDHLGRGVPAADGDDIYNGAVDNATGIAGLIEVARLFASGPRPDRSVVFLAFTAEEKGLLGSEYYASNPVYPLATTVAGFNMDGLPVIGASKDVEVVGYGQSELEDDLQRVATAQGRVVVPEATPEAGSFYRSDHFPLAKRGVPMLYAGSGEDLVNGGKEAGRAAAQDYITKRYHQPDDEWRADWNWDGAIQDLMVNYEIGRGLANSRRWPQWRPSSEFGPVRAQTASARR
ncbi:MAG TPA: M28 family metallopeptidase [Caulobacteraceae bacterium]|nr:M28 family metallopeptidase [Caulobacteraceae bacterium]